jgi:hypothetical protein
MGQKAIYCSLGLRAARVAVKAIANGELTRANMAGNSEINGDLNAHTESYVRFIWWLKFGSVATVLVVALVIFLITR